ncbi:MAG TPA: hypothetical protein VMA86_07255 [Acetobacteraceae bacterium]|nr:hypothetical protein [Acetobacteraceae bacterium]
MTDPVLQALPETRPRALEPALRQAIETEWLALGRAAPIPRAGLAAARVAALAAVAETASALAAPAQNPAENPAGRNAALPGWFAPMAASLPPSPDQLRAVWAELGSGAPLDPADLAVLRALWPLLAPAEAIMETGGDIRLQLDPQTRLNGYGASHRPRPWAITYASTTASSISERGYAAADSARRATTAALLRRGDRRPIATLLSTVRARLARIYGLPRAGAVVLAASGTDTELLALALAHAADPARPVLTILIAPEETGSGVPIAARGRHFAIDTALGHAVAREAPVAGFRPDTTLAAIRLRDHSGAARPLAAVESEIEQTVAAGIAAGRRVVLHALDLSKTGLLAPRPALLKTLRARFGAGFDIVVDACQARLSRASVRAYLDLEAVVLITGSKFLTGPPFSGALLLPGTIAARLAHGRLPEGLDAYFGREEFPARCPAADFLPPTGNYGLALRWVAALAELGALLRISQPRRAAIVARFADTVRAEAAADPALRLLEHPLPERGPHERPWERLPSVFAFAVRAPFAERWLDPDEARAVYRWLNADLSEALPEAPAALAARICHIGQPVALPQCDFLPGLMGVLRVACGARLIAGEPSHRGLGPAERLAREFADVRTVFAKIRLIRASWSRLAAIDPRPHYRSRAP